MEADCDRCEDGSEEIAIWEDDILAGRLDVICTDCRKSGEKQIRPIEPPINEDGELMYHKKYVDCPLCQHNHIVGLNRATARCWVTKLQSDDVTDMFFDVHAADEVPHPYENYTRDPDEGEGEAEQAAA